MRPDIDKMREHYCQGAYIASGHPGVIMKLLAYIDELEERCRAYEQMRHEIARSLDTWKQEEVPDET